MNSGQSRVDPITGAVVSGNTTNPSYGMDVSATLPLFDGFARNHSLRAARAREDAADANYTTTRFQAALAVTNAFFDALANKELLAISNAAVARAEEQLKVASARLRSGSGQRTDSLTALVSLSTARQDRLTAQANLANAEATLGRLVGSETRVAAVTDSAYYRTPTSLDTTALRIDAMQQAPALVASTANLSAAKAQLSQQRSGYWPTLNVSASTNYNAGKTNDYTLEARRQLQVAFQIQPWTNYTRETQIENQSIAVDNAEATLADQRRQVSAQLTQNFASLANAQEAIEVAKVSVQASEENLRVAEQRYKLGVMTIVELMQIQESLTRAQVSEIQARFTYLRTKAQIESIVGRRLP
jgi:outer membrane protein